MKPSRSLRASFKRYLRKGGKHAFRLNDDKDCLGWIKAVGEDAILFEWAPSPFYGQSMGTDDRGPPDEMIPIGEIELTSLSCWDEQSHRWMPFPGL